jgi:hypothetical protein
MTSRPTLRSIFRYSAHYRRLQGSGIAPSALTTRLLAGRPRSLGSIADRIKEFSYSPWRPDRLWGPPSLLFNGIVVISLGVKQRGLATQLSLVPRIRLHGMGLSAIWSIEFLLTFPNFWMEMRSNRGNSYLLELQCLSGNKLKVVAGWPSCNLAGTCLVSDHISDSARLWPICHLFPDYSCLQFHNECDVIRVRSMTFVSDNDFIYYQSQKC